MSRVWSMILHGTCRKRTKVHIDCVVYKWEGPLSLMHLDTWSSSSDTVLECCRIFRRWRLARETGSLEAGHRFYSLALSVCLLLLDHGSNVAFTSHLSCHDIPTLMGSMCLKLWAEWKPSFLKLLPVRHFVTAEERIAKMQHNKGQEVFSQWRDAWEDAGSSSGGTGRLFSPPCLEIVFPRRQQEVENMHANCWT